MDTHKQEQMPRDNKRDRWTRMDTDKMDIYLNKPAFKEKSFEEYNARLSRGEAEKIPSNGEIKRFLDCVTFPKYEENQDHLEFCHQVEKTVKDLKELKVPDTDILVSLYKHMISSSLEKPFRRQAKVTSLDSILQTIKDLDPSEDNTLPTQYYMKAKLDKGEDWTHFIGKVEYLFDRYVPNATKAQKLKAIKDHFFKETKVSIQTQLILEVHDDLRKMAITAKELATREKEMEQRQMEQRWMEQNWLGQRQMEHRWRELKQIEPREEQRQIMAVPRWKNWGDNRYTRYENHFMPHYQQRRDYHGNVETSHERPF